MEKYESAPITEKNLGQAIKYLTRLKGRYVAEKIATCTASVVSLLPVTLLFLISIAGREDLIRKLDSAPFVVLIDEYWNKLPEQWQGILVVLVVLLAPFIVYQLVAAVLFLLLKNMRGILILPGKPIAKARKLYKTAKVLSDTDEHELIRTVVIAVVLVCPIFVMEFFDQGGMNDLSVFISEGDISYLIECLPKVANSFLFLAVMSFLYLIFLQINNVINYLPRSKKDNEYERQARDLEKDLHKYWQSIDPKEAARVAEEERKRRAKYSSVDYTALFTGLESYEQYKRDAMQYLRGGSSYTYTEPSPGLTDKDHDDLDAVQRAARARGDDFHTGV